MGDFGDLYVGAEIAGPGLCLSRFLRRCLQPVRFRPDVFCTELSSSISELSASLRQYHL